MVLLIKYTQYIEKLKLIAEAIQMQIKHIILFICVNKTISGLYNLT